MDVEQGGESFVDVNGIQTWYVEIAADDEPLSCTRAKRRQQVGKLV